MDFNVWEDAALWRCAAARCCSPAAAVRLRPAGGLRFWPIASTTSLHLALQSVYPLVFALRMSVGI